MEQPDIFNYATKELSQDAFICYFLEFGEEKYKKDFPKNYKAVHHFLEECGIGPEEELLEIKRQYNNIDVLAVTSSFVLIIEDKTWTAEHNDQIIRYVKNIKKDGLSEGRKIKVCYLKTGGYVSEYKSSDINVLPQEDCRTLKRKDILKILGREHEDNLIFDNYYRYLDSMEERIKKCDDNDIKTWCSEKWTEYLSSLLKGHDFGITWVPNPKGSFYACYFDWKKCGKGEIYKQLEITFKNGVTDAVKMCLKFSSESKEITQESRELINSLREKAAACGYTKSSRLGRTTTYGYKLAADKNSIDDFVNDAS